MRRLLLSFMVVLLVIGYSTAGEKPILLDVNIGYTGVGSKDNPTKVGEYDSMKSYPSGEVTGTLNVGALDGSFGVYYYTKDEKNYFGDFNLGRVINVRYDFNSMIHRLQHDMMEKDSYYPYFTFPTISGITGTNIKGWTAANPVFQWNGTNVTVPGIQSLILEDLASTSPNKNMIYRSKQSLNVDLTLPFFSYVKPYFAFEQEVRRGWHQTYVMVGKCAPCHTVATTSRIDDTTRDITIGAKINYSIASLNYSHTWRTFDNGRDGMPSLSYDKYTGGISYNFSDRLIYGNNTTYTIYYDERPDIERSTDKLVLKLDLPYYTTGIFQGYWDTTRNNYIDKEYTSNVYALRFVNKAIEGLTLSLTGRYYRLNNDDAKVRIGDLAVTSLSGVYASYGDPAIALNGLPGIPGYPGVFNYTRKSIVDRDVYEVKLDFSYRLTPKYNLTGGYEYKRIERDNSVWKDYWAQPCYTDLTGETVCLDDERFLKDDTTQVHKVKLALSGRPINNLNFRVSYMYQYIDDPLTSKSVGLEYDRL
ncbi:MAG: MtrB/PioB family outer membrane beta-barrel protein, partial [Sulfolobales archaeon]